MGKRRDDLWKGLAEVSDEVASAMSEYTAAQTPQTATRIEKAIHEYTSRLGPVIGDTAAFEFHTSWQAVMDTTGRRMRLLASLSGQSSIDAADVEMMQQLQSETEAALGALEAAEAAMEARLAEAARADGREKP